jgi:hypothetical protein
LFSTDSTHVDDLSDDEDECSSFGLDGVAPPAVAILFFLFTFSFLLLLLVFFNNKIKIAKSINYCKNCNNQTKSFGF